MGLFEVLSAEEVAERESKKTKEVEKITNDKRLHEKFGISRGSQVMPIKPFLEKYNKHGGVVEDHDGDILRVRFIDKTGEITKKSKNESTFVETYNVENLIRMDIEDSRKT
tara:strand:+ start:531 stop:863 length:333 start_codon:yes stop_codon:yes gene_type:complete